MVPIINWFSNCNSVEFIISMFGIKLNGLEIAKCERYRNMFGL